MSYILIFSNENNNNNNNNNTNNKLLQVDFIKIVISLMVSLGYFTFMSVYFILSPVYDIIKILIPFYFMIMSLQLATSILRFKGFSDELISSQILSIVGTCLFTISDTILLISLLISEIKYGEVISISMYWLGIYFIGISVHRTNNISIIYNSNNSGIYLLR
jgi:hypothetical protein